MPIDRAGTAWLRCLTEAGAGLTRSFTRRIAQHAQAELSRGWALENSRTEFVRACLPDHLPCCLLWDALPARIQVNYLCANWRPVRPPVARKYCFAEK